MSNDDQNGIDYSMLQSRLGYKLRRAQLVYFDVFFEACAQEGITPGLFSILAIIYHNPGLTQSAVSTALDVDRSAMVAAIDKLESMEVVERRMRVHQLPAALVGERLVQISDLHVGPRVDDEYLMNALDRVRALRPGILTITGDLVSYWGDGTFAQLDRVLGHLPRGSRATIAVLGNHDYGRRWSQPKIADRISARLRLRCTSGEASTSDTTSCIECRL